MIAHFNAKTSNLWAGYFWFWFTQWPACKADNSYLFHLASDKELPQGQFCSHYYGAWMEGTKWHKPIFVYWRIILSNYSKIVDNQSTIWLFVSFWMNCLQIWVIQGLATCVNFYKSLTVNLWNLKTCTYPLLFSVVANSLSFLFSWDWSIFPFHRLHILDTLRNVWKTHNCWVLTLNLLIWVSWKQPAIS